MTDTSTDVKSVISKAEAEMHRVIDKLQGEYGALRTGRANPMVLDSIKVEYYGSEVPLKQVAAISVPESRVIEIRPWDPTALDAVMKALQTSGIGIPPASDGKAIRLNFPAMNEDRRKELVKAIGRIAEEYRVSMRNARRDAIESVKRAEKSKAISEDDRRTLEGTVQKLTDSFIKKVDEMLAAKEKEILTV